MSGSRDRAATHSPRPVPLTVALASLAALLACNPGGHALLLVIQSTTFVETFDLRVKSVATGRIVLDRGGEPIDPADETRDISTPGNELKLAIEFDKPGDFVVYILGRLKQGSAGRQFSLRRFAVSGIQQHRIKLIPLARDDDLDGVPACSAEAELDCTTIDCPSLDCDDEDDEVHPFAPEVCGNDLDDDCSAGCGGGKAGDIECKDEDRDGVASDKDCDDRDPCRSPEIREVESLCNLAPDETPSLPRACLDALSQAGEQREPPFCDNGVDEDCSGQDLPCRVDEDCDNFSPPEDCDDTDPAVNTEAKETCGDGVDNNCSGVVDEGCIPCDVDGDGHAAPDTDDPACKDTAGQPLPRDDDDDHDAGVNPSTTEGEVDGKEGGTLLGALRRYCSYELSTRGKRQRDEDHDGDGSIAAADGCAAEECDGDGDGFPGPQCNPPASIEDCNDSNAKIFPGAPDYCGDGIKQNCVSESDCTSDADGDHYQGGEDCDDSRGDRHPWGVELCNGVDDDCDKLVDEGNPGSDGEPIPTGPDDKRCNAASEGRCGGGGSSALQACNPATDANCSADGRLLSGVCVCSRLEPVGFFDAARRVACPGESTSSGAGVRCFGAIQPEIERCDEEDWDCDGRPDDPEGSRPLVDRGKPCSTNRPTCQAGKVVGCDLEAPSAEAELIEQVLRVQGIEHNRFWVCSGALLPTAEVCDGKDDDCDGTLPDDEQDGDGDGFLPCSGCTLGDERLALDPALQGCDDCDDALKAVYPGAPEVCNGRDDDCDSNTGDGADSCSSSMTCCPTLHSCKNLQTDPTSCGQCGRRCATGESCSSGQCVCGSSQESCSAGQSCISGSCTCVTGGNCTGCCEGDTCNARSAATCGANGSECVACSAGECEEPICDASGSCDTRTASDGTPCDNNRGQCHSGTCCKSYQCWDLSTSQCVSGRSNDSACGGDGDVCVDCTDSSERCKNYVCQ